MTNTNEKEKPILSIYKLAKSAVIYGVAGGLIINLLMPSNKIPATSEVQQGFVIPSKLEIKLQDLDKNGQKETIMQYDRKNYLLILDEQGKPRIQNDKYDSIKYGNKLK